MRIALLPECGEQIGIGHLERSIALATELSAVAETLLCLPEYQVGIDRAVAAGMSYVIRTGPPNAPALDEVAAISADVLVLDGYHFAPQLQRALRELARVALVDDLSLDCDVDLLVNPCPGGELLPDPPGAGRVISGAAYAIISAPYRQARDRREAAGTAGASRRSAVVVSGGDDVGGLLRVIPEQLARVEPPLDVTVVVGPGARAPQLPPGMKVAAAPPSLADVYEASTIYVGAAGTSSVQAAAVGLPMVITPIAYNQVAQAAALRDSGAAIVVAESECDQLGARVAELIADPPGLARMSRAAVAMVDGQGASRVASAIMGLR